MRASRRSMRSAVALDARAGGQQRRVGAVGVAGGDDARRDRCARRVALRRAAGRARSAGRARGRWLRAPAPRRAAGRRMPNGLPTQSAAVAADMLQVQAGDAVGWPSGGRGSCSRGASRRCRARTPPAAPAPAAPRRGKYRRTGTARWRAVSRQSKSMTVVAAPAVSLRTDRPAMRAPASDSSRRAQSSSGDACRRGAFMRRRPSIGPELRTAAGGNAACAAGCGARTTAPCRRRR